MHSLLERFRAPSHGLGSRNNWRGLFTWQLRIHCPSHVLPLTEPGAIRVALKSLFQHIVTVPRETDVKPNDVALDVGVRRDAIKLRC